MTQVPASGREAPSWQLRQGQCPGDTRCWWLQPNKAFPVRKGSGVGLGLLCPLGPWLGHVRELVSSGTALASRSCLQWASGTRLLPWTSFPHRETENQNTKGCCGVSGGLCPLRCNLSGHGHKAAGLAWAGGGLHPTHLPPGLLIHVADSCSVLAGQTLTPGSPSCPTDSHGAMCPCWRGSGHPTGWGWASRLIRASWMFSTDSKAVWAK